MLGESSYASRENNSCIGSDQMLLREVALAQPHGGFPLVRASARDLEIPFPPLEDERAKTHQIAAPFHDTDHPLHDRTSLPLKRGMSQATCRTIHFISALSVVGLYVLRAGVQCCQHCAHLSLQLCLIVFHCSVALMRSSGRGSDD